MKKHQPNNVYTELGYIKAEIQGLSSTKAIKWYGSIYTIIHNSDKTFMDLTGHFPYKSSRGNEYILIVYHVNSNVVFGTPIKKDKEVLLHKHGSS